MTKIWGRNQTRSSPLRNKTYGAGQIAVQEAEQVIVAGALGSELEFNHQQRSLEVVCSETLTPLG